MGKRCREYWSSIVELAAWYAPHQTLIHLFPICKLNFSVLYQRYSLMKAQVEAQVIEAFEINNIANDVYQHNFSHCTYQGNIQSLTAADLDKYGAHAWLLSPPCQPYTRQGDFFFFSFYDNLFSSVSKMSLNNLVLGLQKDTGDARAFSFIQILELIPFLLRPPSVLFVENVVGFETSDTHAKLIEILEKTNFITQEFILSPLQLGVPYSRPRYFSCRYSLAKRKPSSFGNEFLSRQLIQSPKTLFEPFNAYAKEDDLSLEDRHNLFQSCQPIEKFLVLKNLSNDTNVKPEASATSVSNDISRTSEEDNEDEYDSLDKYYVHPSLLERWGS
ncbi:hypothetical protein RYX36_004292, partial [Vicia faba]